MGMLSQISTLCASRLREVCVEVTISHLCKACPFLMIEAGCHIGVHREAANLPKSILFLAQTRNSPTVEEQLAACGAPDDLIVEAGRLSLGRLAERLERKGMALQSGDRLKIYDLSCLAISTATLIRIFVKTLGAGVSLEVRNS